MLLRKRAARRCRSIGAPAARRFAGAASATATLFPGFERATVRSTAMGTPDINVVHSPKPGAPTLLLLHGYPQTHVEWHKVAPPLAERFAVVCPDLRGYGDSSKPERGDHDMYSKRTTAADVLSVLGELGYAEPVHVVGHDVRAASPPPPPHTHTAHYHPTLCPRPTNAPQAYPPPHSPPFTRGAGSEARAWGIGWRWTPHPPCAPSPRSTSSPPSPHSRTWTQTSPSPGSTGTSCASRSRKSRDGRWHLGCILPQECQQ